MPRKSPQKTSPAVLVGTYRKDQLAKWILPRGLYNYPVSENDSAIREAAPTISELWLYAGKSGELRFSAKFEREVSTAELDSLGYPRGKSKPHSDRYLLFRIAPFAEAQLLFPEPREIHIFLRLTDFTRSPKVRAQLKRSLKTSGNRAAVPSDNAEKQLHTTLPESMLDDWLGIKRPDCAPALVAIVQVPIIGPVRRRMTVREAARLQSFPDEFIPNQDKHQAYKQFGNAA